MRTNSPALDAILGEALPVLDHGFIRVVDYMGNDAAVVQAARVSYGEGTKTPSDDEALIRYLLRHRHTTPFEMCELKLHLKMPIFVARQWLRHRTASVNELSARYSVMPEEFYVPEVPEICVQSSDNKQGRGTAFTENEARGHQDDMRTSSEQSFEAYKDFGHYEVARETARIVLPLNTYTEFYWKLNLHNLLHFVGLRADPHAQWEIRQYAEIILDILRKWVPFTAQAFQDYRMDAVTFSGPAMEAVRWMVHGRAPVNREESGMGKREYDEMLKVLDL